MMTMKSMLWNILQTGPKCIETGPKYSYDFFCQAGNKDRHTVNRDKKSITKL